MKTSELIGHALDWAVAQCEELAPYVCLKQTAYIAPEHCATVYFRPSTNWSQGGPIIEREDISFRKYHRPDSPAHGTYYAKVCRESGTMVQWSNRRDSTGPTPLIAAMRCYVTSKLGEEVDIPKELK